MKKKAKTKNKYPKQYLSGLSKKDKDKQRSFLNRAKKSYKKERGSKKYIDRPKLKSYKNKSSSWTEKFHKLYPDAKTIKDISKVTGIPKGALLAVIKKGKGAYYSSGSRPNQTAESWGKARMYSYILGGPTRKVDHHITEEYKVKFKHKSVVKGGASKRKKKKKTRKKRENKIKKETYSRGALKKHYVHDSASEYSNSECPKVQFHQAMIDKEGPHWIKVNLKREIIEEDDDVFTIDNERVDTGIYIMVVLKEDPNTLYLLKEYSDLQMLNFMDYPISQDSEWPTYGHSSIFRKKEYSIEWMKETVAREFEKEASMIQDKKKQESLFKKAKQARGQCLLLYAGKLYYDKEILLWTNHSGHFQPKEENMKNVGLPQKLFKPMGSTDIDEILKTHILNSPPTSPTSSPLTSKTTMSKFLSLMSNK